MVMEQQAQLVSRHTDDGAALLLDGTARHRLAHLIEITCGNDNTLLLDRDSRELLGELWSKGMEAQALQPAESSSLSSLPFADDQFTTVVSVVDLGKLADDQLPAALREIRRVTSRYIFLSLPAATEPGSTLPSRAWWEARCYEAGLRKHPLYYVVNPYEALNNDGARVYVLLEKVAEPALLHFDLTVLEEERLLHTDMLRETGRRSDAHCIRYHKAAELIRPGDHVLDVACGLGYGSHMLYANSDAASVLGVDLSDFGIDYANAHYGLPGKVDFRVGDAQALDSIPSNSIDFITAFETIEHVPKPIAYLKALKRVLRPSGRILICAPNNWADETGEDPNPHHLHVYTWDRLVAEVGAHFMLEKGMLQTAGGAMRCHFSPRSWVQVSPEQPLPVDGEWIILLGMADPIGHEDVPYTENFWKTPDTPDFHVAAFARDYQNPWLMRSMVTRGMRADSAPLLANLQNRVLEQSEAGSVDHGAALCGRIYGLLEARQPDATLRASLLEQARNYCAQPNPNPQQLRWQVSLLYACAELALGEGRQAEAIAWYEACASKDVMPYSPLLGNKTLDAYHRLATLAIGRHDYARARTYLQQAAAQAVRLASGPWLNIIGDTDAPLPFGFSEMSQLMDKASRAGYMLHALDDIEAKPGRHAQESQGFHERQITTRDERIQHLEHALASLAPRLEEKDTEIARLHGEVKHLHENSLQLAAEVQRQHDNAQRIAAELQAQHEHAQRLAVELLGQSDTTQRIASELGNTAPHTSGSNRELIRTLASVSKTLLRRALKRIKP